MTQNTLKVAERLKNKTDFKGAAALYRFSPPLPDYRGNEHEFVVVSAIILPKAMGGGAETYLFPANAQGDVVSWLEMPGSQKGTLSHQEVIEGLGYQYTISAETQ